MLNHIKLAAASVLAACLFATTATLAVAEDNISSSAAQSIIDNQIKSFRSGDFEQAFSHASPNLKKMFGSAEKFVRMVKSGYGAIYGAQRWSFGRSRNVSGMLYQEVQLVGPKGGNWTALYS
ncbi:MAG: DUF4864 domain-containing protein, partial [Rhizobiaceae bacterium]